MKLLELVNISKVYRTGGTTLHALDNVNIEVIEGEFAAITGASGSGKSTMMNLLGLLDTPTAGTYRFMGEDVSKMNEKTLTRLRNKSIGFIFQSFNLISTLTAEENVELPLIYRGVPNSARKELVKNALEAVGISHRKTHRPSELSGGQQQRVAIARAVAASPSLILADEPTGNLDSAAGETVMSLLKGLHAGGATVVIITHDPKIAQLAGRVITVSDGKVVGG
ncbi:MAG: ABC transporter ATP-binding protein [Ruminococcus sp.]|jgi:putative ABC transport system ATP-binding protein|nr:ABC transporter ATP-binding protein [Ruminococcus sp.]